MRKIIFIVTIFILTGCSDDFLDRKPKGNLTADTFFENEDHAILATNAIYQNFRSWEYCGLPYIGATDIISDDADKGSTENDAIYLQELDDFQFDATNQTFSSIWRGHYNSISRSNLLLSRIDDITMNDALKQRLKGEAIFLRAFNYYRLVQWFGDIPLITTQLTEDEYFTQIRNTTSEVYAFLESELQTTITLLPERNQYPASDLGRVTKGAAKSLLAKVFMLQYKFMEAFTTCEEVINSGQYSLMPNYNQIFLQSGENGVESIFEIGAVALQASVAGSGATPFNMVQGVRGVPNLGWGFNRPSDNLILAYEPGDPRRQATIIYVGEVLPDGSTIVQDNPEVLNERFNQKAWVGPHPGLQDNGPGNIRLIRYADILLLAAEAANEIGNNPKALEYVNMVRRRARGTNNFILRDLTTTDQNILRNEIRRERRVELAMEQQRWFDLKRWGIQAEVMIAIGKPFVSNKHELFPLPQVEIDLADDNLNQNPGY